MTRLRLPSPAVLVVALAVAGLCAVVAGVYVELGLGPALIMGGALAALVGFLADV